MGLEKRDRVADCRRRVMKAHSGVYLEYPTSMAGAGA